MTQFRSSVLALLFLASCSQPTQPEQPAAVVNAAPPDGSSQPPAAANPTVSTSGIEPMMDIFIEDPLQPVIHGATNLPDGSELIVSLSRPESGYTGESKVTVQSGHFTTEQFSVSGDPLNPGTYTLEVSMGIAATQPDQVQAVIGDQGQKMTGKFVTASPLGGSVFDYKTQEQLGGAPNAMMDAAAKSKSDYDLKKWEAKSCASITDFVNEKIRSGDLTGRQTLGPERQEEIAACTARLNTPRTQ